MVLALALLLSFAIPALGALQVTVEPERVSPVTLGEARVWNAYITVTVLRDGGPGEGAPVELRGPAGTLASGRADPSGKAVLPVLSREPLSIEVWVDGAFSGRRVELAAGPGSASPAAVPQPQGLPIGYAAVATGALAMTALLLKKRFKRGN